VYLGAGINFSGKQIKNLLDQPKIRWGVVEEKIYQKFV
jgi:hypothetical protein